MKQNEEDRKNFDKRWDKINQKLKQKDSNFVEPVIPFKQNSLIRDYNELYLKIYDKEKFMNI